MPQSMRNKPTRVQAEAHLISPPNRTAPKIAHVDNLGAAWFDAVELPQLVRLRLLGEFVTGQTETHQCET